MDWSPSDLRSCLLDPRFRPKPRVKGSGGPVDPTGVLQAALKELHGPGGGADAAMARLEQTLQGETYRQAKYAGRAERARRHLATYCRLVAGDRRPAVLGRPRAKIALAGQMIPAGYDVVLHDDRGYVARSCIWSPTKRPFEPREPAIIANPIVAAVREDFAGAADEQDLFGELLAGPEVIAVEIAELEHDRLSVVTAADAARAAGDLAAIAARALPTTEA